jgi:hypothetical protein
LPFDRRKPKGENDEGVERIIAWHGADVHDGGLLQCNGITGSAGHPGGHRHQI